MTSQTSVRAAASPGDRPIPVVSSTDLEIDPHGTFRRWRPMTPVIEREDGACLILRAADVQRLLADPRTRQIDGAVYARMRGVQSGPLFDLLSASVLLSEGESHIRRRTPLAPPMAFNAVEALRSAVRAAADELIDGFAEAGEAELVKVFCAPLPPLVMSRLLGVPDDDAMAFAGWVHQLSPAFGAALPDEDMGAMTEGAERLGAYVAELLGRDTNDTAQASILLESLRRAMDAGTIGASEAAAQLVTLIIGASDTTRGALAIQTSLLLERSVSWRDLGRDPERVRAVVAEALRFEPPVGSFPRFSTEDIELEGFIIPAGRLVSLSTLSAMRDPALFSDPDAFVIDRTDQVRWHLAFGGGAHRCVGEALARLELEEGLKALRHRFPGLRLVGPPVRVTGYAEIRRISDLRVAW